MVGTAIAIYRDRGGKTKDMTCGLVGIADERMIVASAAGRGVHRSLVAVVVIGDFAVAGGGLILVERLCHDGAFEPVLGIFRGYKVCAVVVHSIRLSKGIGVA